MASRRWRGEPNQERRLEKRRLGAVACMETSSRSVRTSHLASRDEQVGAAESAWEVALARPPTVKSIALSYGRGLSNTSWTAVAIWVRYASLGCSVPAH